MQCTTGLLIKPLAEEVAVDKKWLQNKKAWMISYVEEDGENLKVKMISGDIRMLTWNVTANLFPNVELRKVISLLGITTPSEKDWREKLANLIIYREEMKLKKKEMSRKISEERRRNLEQMEKEITEGKCRVLKNPDIIIYEKNRRNVFVILEYLLYSCISKLE